jgi:hypothetical protein
VPFPHEEPRRAVPPPKGLQDLLLDMEWVPPRIEENHRAVLNTLRSLGVCGTICMGHHTSFPLGLPLSGGPVTSPPQ